MIDAPRIQIVLQKAAIFEVEGPLADRVQRFATSIGHCWSLGKLPARSIRIIRVPRQHVGLGVGTQLGLAVAAGLNACLERPPLSPLALAQAAGRGLRSVVGTYGFVHGGMIVQTCHTEPNHAGPLVNHIRLPSSWRFVLLCPNDQVGLSGPAEKEAFARLQPVLPETSAALEKLATTALLPTARGAAFQAFSQHLYLYGYLAGQGFSTIQGSPFASTRLERLVAAIRAAGVAGVGQSSWGPTVFALFADGPTAEAFVAEFRRRPEAASVTFTIASPDNQGASIEVG